MPSNTMWLRPRSTSIPGGVFIQPFGHNRHGPTIEWGGGCAFFLGELGLHLTQSHGPRPISIPSGILVHPSVWPQWRWAKNWGCAPFGES